MSNIYKDYQLSVDALHQARADIATRDAEIARLTEALENAQAAAIHSCGDDCQRPACVLRRENARLTANGYTITP